jgi:hypothetical protein
LDEISIKRHCNLFNNFENAVCAIKYIAVYLFVAPQSSSPLTNKNAELKVLRRRIHILPVGLVDEFVARKPLRDFLVGSFRRVGAVDRILALVEPEFLADGDGIGLFRIGRSVNRRGSMTPPTPNRSTPYDADRHLVN